MIASRQEIAEIRAGTLDELVGRDPPPPVGSVQPVKAGSRNQPALHVRVLDSWAYVTRPGHHVVRFELAADPKPRVRRRVEKPRLMSRGGGYTSEPEYALRDTAAEPDELVGLPPEPEAVDRQTQSEFSGEARTIDGLREQKRREEWERQALWERLYALEESGLDPREIAQIDRRLKAFEHKRRRFGKAA